MLQTSLNAQFAPARPALASRRPRQLLNPITRASNETNALAVQLQTVAKVIAANQVLGIRTASVLRLDGRL